MSTGYRDALLSANQPAKPAASSGPTSLAHARGGTNRMAQMSGPVRNRGATSTAAGPSSRGRTPTAGSPLGVGSVAANYTGSQYTRGSDSTIAERTGLEDQFRDALSGQLESHALPERNVEGRINTAMDAIASNEASAGAMLANQAGGEGFGRGGGMSGGMRSLYEGFGGLKSDTTRDIRSDAEAQAGVDQGREDQRQLQATGIASQNLMEQQRLDLQREMAEKDYAARMSASNALRQGGGSPRVVQPWTAVQGGSSSKPTTQGLRGSRPGTITVLQGGKLSNTLKKQQIESNQRVLDGGSGSQKPAWVKPAMKTGLSQGSKFKMPGIGASSGGIMSA